MEEGGVSDGDFEDLYENMLALLRHNRRLSAEKEVAEERSRKRGRDRVGG